MNRLRGVVRNIESSPTMALVDVDVKGERFSSIILDGAGETFVKPGDPVMLVFKETEVGIAKNMSGFLSFRNRIHSRVAALDKDEILAKVTLDYKGEKVVSIISRRSAEEMGLKSGDAVEGVVKMNEITLIKEAGDDA